MAGNTEKFSGRAEVYAEARPAYAPQAVDALRARGIGPGRAVADVGCGTGIFARQLLETGCTVYGVEPNGDMRAAARGFAGRLEFLPVCGQAEATTLPDACVDAVTAAQAFHWFDADAFRLECARILKPAGFVALLWNHRAGDAAVNLENARICAEFCPEFAGFSNGERSGGEKMTRFFESGYETLRFSNPLRYDRARFVARNRSSSYSIPAEHPRYGAYIAALEGLFDRFAEGGVLTVPNDTVLHIGRVRG